MKPNKLQLFLIWAVLIFGCGKNPESIISEWKQDGWSYVTTHGKKGPIDRTGTLQSKKAQAVEAAWIERGQRKTTVYNQTQYFYAVRRYLPQDKDEFVVVMQERK